MLHRVIGFEHHCQLVGGESAVGLVNGRIEEHGFARLLLDGCAGADDVGSVIAGGDEVNIGLQVQLICVGVVVRAGGCTRRLEGPETNRFVSVGLPRLLIEA